MPPQSSFRLPCSGLERNVRAQLNHSRAIVNARGHICEIQYARGPETGRVNEIPRIPPVWMVKRVQELALQGKTNPFSDGDDFCKRHIVIPHVRPMQPWIDSKCSRRRILAYTRNDRVASTSATSPQ